MSHTPTPWKVVGKVGIVANSTYLADIISVNFTEKEDADNAQFIVKAVNAHDDLVAALKDALARSELRTDTKLNAETLLRKLDEL